MNNIVKKRILWPAFGMSLKYNDLEWPLYGRMGVYQHIFLETETSAFETATGLLTHSILICMDYSPRFSF